MYFYRDDPRLFSDGRLYETLQGVEEKLKKEVDAYEANRFLNTPVEDLCSYFAEKFSVAPLELRTEEISVDQQETTFDTSRHRDGLWLFGSHQPTVPGTLVEFFLPFAGDPDLLRLQPSTFTMSPPRAQVRGQELVFAFTVYDLNDAELKTEFERQLREVQGCVRSSAGMVTGFNGGLPNVARQAVSSRRERLLRMQNTSVAIGYPMRRRADAPQTYAPPSVRRRLRPSPPPASSAPYQPEPALASEDYEHILSVLQSVALVLERSPSAFKTMGEEDLRQHLLVHLNGHYEGRATGETFNGEGKTDILIRENDRNIFIAECKFWRGPAAFTATIDQLLGYLSWRDTKTAVVLFNRDTALSTVLSKIPEGLSSHPNFKRRVDLANETQFRAVFRHRDDPNRELILTVLAFNVPH